MAVKLLVLELKFEAVVSNNFSQGVLLQKEKTKARILKWLRELRLWTDYMSLKGRSGSSIGKKTQASAQMAWVRTRLSLRGFLDAFPSRFLDHGFLRP